MFKSPAFLRGFLLDDLFGDASEDFWVLASELREDLAVELVTSFLQFINESRVGLMAIVAERCVETHYPELAEVGLLIASVGEGVTAGAHECFVRVAFLLRANATVALGPLENVLAALLRHYASFDSCHKLLN